jgi:hypothetical protein
MTVGHQLRLWLVNWLLVGALVLFVLFMLGVVVGPAKVIAPQPEAPKPTKGQAAPQDR